VACGLPHIDRAGRAERLRVVLLCDSTPGNYRASDAVVMVQVDTVWAQGAVDEVSVHKVGAEHEASGDLALNTHVGMQCGPGWNINGIQSSRRLLRDLNSANRRV